MDTLSFEQLKKFIDTNNAEYYNVYNSDQDVITYFSADYYINNKQDNADIDQKLNIAFTDIEVYQQDRTVKFNFDGDEYPINAITTYITHLKTFFVSYILIPTNAHLFDSNYDFLGELKQQKYCDDDCKLQLTVYTDEKVMLTDHWNLIKSNNVAVLSGFNCVSENEYIWLDNKITTLKKLQLDSKLFDNRIVNLKHNSGKKQEFILTTGYGNKISCSEDHRFPILIKPKTKYKRYSSLLATATTLSIKDIVTEMIDNDVYVGLRKGNNTNSNITYKQLLIDNLDIYKEYPIDFQIIDDNINSKYGHDFKTCVDNGIENSILIEYISSVVDLNIRKNKLWISINIDREINPIFFKLLGLQYTDGTYDRYGDNFAITNIDLDLMFDYCEYVNLLTKRNSNVTKIKEIKGNSWTVNQLFRLKFTYNNELLILLPLIYTQDFLKTINVELFSSISNKQFQYFLAGVIDGDAHINSKGAFISVAMFNQKVTDDKYQLQSILLWNGIFSSIQKDTTHIITNDLSEEFISTLPLSHREKQIALSNLNYIEIKNTASKKLKKYEDESYAYVRLKSIERTDNEMQMYDISVSRDSLFICNGILTHNCDTFDLPYIYRRMIKLFTNKYEVNNMISSFGYVELGYNKMLKIPDYVILDVLYLYKPRADGGMNYGRKQANYKLDSIAEYELNIKKLEHGLELGEFFEKDPTKFALYNIIDVALCVKLNDKLQHIALHNLIRRRMGISINRSLIGSSALFDCFVLTNLLEKQEYVRHAMSTENNKTFSIESLTNIPVPITEKKKAIVPLEISKQEYTKFVNKFAGAYVKSPNPGITNDGTVIDLDASLPPWEKVFIRRNGYVFWNEIGNYEYLENDETLTWNNKGETCWKKVLGKVTHPWTNKHGKLLKITTKTGKTVTVTDNHSIFGIQKGVKTDNYYLLDAKQLKVGDYIVGMKHFEPGGVKSSHNPELLGFWLSDGWVASQNATYYIAKQDKSKLDVFYPDIDNIRLKKNASEKYKEEWVGKVAEPVRTELKDFYVSTKRKSFIELLNYPLEERLLAWKGMYDADGTLHGTTQRLCKYRLPELEECFIIAHTIDWNAQLTVNGIDNSKRYDSDMVAIEVICSHRGYGGSLTRLKLSGNNRHPYYKLQDEMPWVRNCYTEDIGLETITKIEEIEYEGDVYDLSVEDTQRFWAGLGLGVHNTSLYPSMIQQHNVGFRYLCRQGNTTNYI